MLRYVGFTSPFISLIGNRGTRREGPEYDEVRQLLLHIPVTGDRLGQAMR